LEHLAAALAAGGRPRGRGDLAPPPELTSRARCGGPRRRTREPAARVHCRPQMGVPRGSVPRVRFTAVLLAAALTFSTTVVRADDPPVCGEAPEDADVRRRLEVLSRHVRQEEPPIRRWFTTFALLH